MIVYHLISKTNVEASSVSKSMILKLSQKHKSARIAVEDQTRQKHGTFDLDDASLPSTETGPNTIFVLAAHLDQPYVYGSHTDFQSIKIQYEKMKAKIPERMSVYEFTTTHDNVIRKIIDTKKGKIRTVPRTSEVADSCFWLSVGETKSEHISLLLLVTCVTTGTNPSELLHRWRALVDYCRSVYEMHTESPGSIRISTVWKSIQKELEVCYDITGTNFLVDLLTMGACQCSCGVLALREIMVSIDSNLSAHLRYLTKKTHIRLAYLEHPDSQDPIVSFIDTTGKAEARPYTYDAPENNPYRLVETDAYNAINLVRLLDELKPKPKHHAMKLMAEHLELNELTGVYRLFALIVLTENKRYKYLVEERRKLSTRYYSILKDINEDKAVFFWEPTTEKRQLSQTMSHTLSQTLSHTSSTKKRSKKSTQ